MSDEAQEAFVKGKQLIEAEKAGEAASVFAVAVRLSPNNAKYRAWYARSLAAYEYFDAAINEANCAIALDPNCSEAYYQLSYAQYRRGFFPEAISNISRAINMEPNLPNPYHLRARIYYTLENFEDALADTSQVFQLTPDEEPEKWILSNNEFEMWNHNIYEHLMGFVWPRLRASDERFVEYFPCRLKWGEITEIVNGYTQTSFSFGSGYICLTNKNIYLYSLAQISHQFPLFKQGLFPTKGLEMNDRSWSVPYNTVIGAQITDEPIKLVTAAMTWDIYNLFRNFLPEILGGIKAGCAGKYIHKSNVPIPQKNAVTKENIIGLLNQLGELKAQGIISESEFEQKKKELLARL